MDEGENKLGEFFMSDGFRLVGMICGVALGTVWQMAPVYVRVLSMQFRPSLHLQENSSEEIEAVLYLGIDIR